VPILLNWVNAAILSAATLSAANIIDSHLLSRRMPNFQVYLLPVGTIYLIFGWILFTLFPLPEGITLWPVLVAVISCILRTAGIIILLYTLIREEVSRVIPVAHTYPIFVAIMAAPLLGESLGYLKWLAIIIVVAGAVMISVKQSPSGATTWLSKPFLLLFGASLLFAISNVASKYALAYISFWNMSWFIALCLAGVFLLISLRPHTIRQLINLEKRSLAIGLITLTEILAMGAMILTFLAIEKGPVSLASAVIGSRPIFVVILALLLSRVSPMFLEWQPGKGMLALRLIATAMIIGGITIIYLT